MDAAASHQPAPAPELRQPRARLRRLPADDKTRLRAGTAPNIGIVTAYNDMLSAHQPFEPLSRR